MAAAEARAAWQRAANRCIVQEDAKRAPKLPPCCSSSSSNSSSSSQNHEPGNYPNTPNQTDHPQIPNFSPLNWNPISDPTNNLPPDTKWWLQFQPNFGYQKEFLYYDQLNSLQDEKKNNVETSNFDDTEFEIDHAWMVSTTFTKHTNQEKKLKYEVKSCEPWWRVNNEKELASMVAQRAKEKIENCDLPRPTQTQTFNFGFDGIARNYCDDDKNVERRESTKRAELLEALCHSQTRAREAELAAKKAEHEKQDILKLLFRQASHLFACKQWIKMLQLENMCLQLRLRDHPIPWLVPSPPPSSKERREKENKGDFAKKKKKGGVCRYIVVFAVGLGLVGAGLLFGWTLGWLLPK